MTSRLGRENRKPFLQCSLHLASLPPVQGWIVFGSIRDAASMRLQARELAQHGGPPGWLKGSGPAGCDLVRDGRSMPPALKDHTTWALVLGRIYSIIKCTQNIVISYVT